jgi:hypothetical protein
MTEGWQQRLIDEAEDLEIRIKKLSEFANSEEFKSLDSTHRDFLRIQQYHMGWYLWALKARIKRISEPAEAVIIPIHT